MGIAEDHRAEFNMKTAGCLDVKLITKWLRLQERILLC